MYSRNTTSNFIIKEESIKEWLPKREEAILLGTLFTHVIGIRKVLKHAFFILKGGFSLKWIIKEFPSNLCKKWKRTFSKEQNYTISEIEGQIDGLIMRDNLSKNIDKDRLGIDYKRTLF